MEAVEELVKYLGPEGRNWIETEEYKNLEKLNKYLDTLFGEEYGAKPRTQRARTTTPTTAQKSPTPLPKTPKYPETKKAVEEPKTQTNPFNIALEARKLLGILSGLKFANYSSEAIQNAVKSLELEVERLSENPVENLELVGLYCLVIRALEKGDFEKAEKLLKSFSGG